MMTWRLQGIVLESQYEHGLNRSKSHPLSSDSSQASFLFPQLFPILHIPFCLSTDWPEIAAHISHLRRPTCSSAPSWYQAKFVIIPECILPAMPCILQLH